MRMKVTLYGGLALQTLLVTALPRDGVAYAPPAQQPLVAPAEEQLLDVRRYSLPLDGDDSITLQALVSRL